MSQVSVCDGVNTIIREAGVVDINVLVIVRHIPFGHPQIRYREARYSAAGETCPESEAEFERMAEIVANYVGVLHQEFHVSPFDPRVSIRCFGCKSTDLPPLIQHGTIILGVLSLDGVTRPWIHGQLRSEGRPVKLIQALYA